MKPSAGGLPLQLLHAGEEPAARTGLPELDVPADRVRHTLEDAARQLSYAHPALEITRRRAAGPAADVLVSAAGSSAALVLGSRGFTGFAGFLVGSVALAVSARATCPVILVRAGERPEDEHWDSEAGPYRPVVLFTNQRTGRCVTAPASGSGSVTMAFCNATDPTQQWGVYAADNPDGSGWYDVWVNQSSGLCLSTPSVRNGTVVQTTPCDPSDQYDRWHNA